MDKVDVRVLQERFRAWLGSDPEAGAWIVAQLLGYSLGYVRWATSLAGQRPWRERTPEELARAFRQREVLYDPGQTD